MIIQIPQEVPHTTDFNTIVIVSKVFLRISQLVQPREGLLEEASPTLRGIILEISEPFCILSTSLCLLLASAT